MKREARKLFDLSVGFRVRDFNELEISSLNFILLVI